MRWARRADGARRRPAGVPAQLGVGGRVDQRVLDRIELLALADDRGIGGVGRAGLAMGGRDQRARVLERPVVVQLESFDGHLRVAEDLLVLERTGPLRTGDGVAT